ncbi:hemagglutinin repeat-containing protein [Pseudomonas sp. GD03860]|uniref:hemagglutinin repeat-containing protein n=1 Tax=Pseudomonas TaxID=286 RepID=UPI0023644B49|nr:MULTISPECIES: hemagglutinin repeat-containing protein [Pseudomonas]MDD2060427.1 hemagglutinin repeat-containing protein [Pseudomonas putida]MDH0635561.1 hemagglutinin repeat-containing protein [Pseudomonas sp. GD03860]
MMYTLPTPSASSWLTPNHLRWMIALSLLAPCVGLADTGLQPIAGAGGVPVISNAHGVPVIAIVAPNAGGLSHNQFLDYNVNKPGVVLNNATEAGRSQLAGALAANPQFQGQAASTILTEVISRNTSRIEGPQEIFGRPADYILANPNGITLNGGSFINTTRAGFLVGNVETDGQGIKLLDTRNSTGSLQVLDGGQSNLAGALDLIAPRIETTGPLNARDALNLTTGRNLIRNSDHVTLEHLASPEGSIDASLFGAMQAGRIRIVSTAEGAGVHVGSRQMVGHEGIDIHSAGALQVSGSAKQPSQLSADQGAVNLASAQDLGLSAVQVEAQRIQAKAGKNLNLDAQTRESLKHDSEKREKKWLFVTTETYNRDTTRTDRTQTGSSLHASQGITLEAGQDMNLVAATVDAGGELKVKAGDKLTVAAGIDSTQVDEKIRHRKHLWRGDTDSSVYEERAKSSTLSGAQVSLESGGATRILGSQVTSPGDIALKASSLEVAEVALKHSQDAKGYSGDLVSGAFFGKNSKSVGEGHKASGSAIQSGGTLNVVADEVQIRGSKVKSKGDALVISEKGQLSIEAAQSESSLSRRENDSKLLGLIGHTREHQEQRKDVLKSDLSSDSDLRLASADEIRVIGSKLEAAKQLQLKAQKDITIGTAEQLHTSTSKQQDRGFTASAGQTQNAGDGKPDSHQYSASVGYNVNTVDTRTSDKKQLASELNGGQVQLISENDVTVKGSHAAANAGDVEVNAKNLNLVAAQNEQSVVTTTTHSGGGLKVSGGIDALGSAFEGYRKQQVRNDHGSQAQGSSLTSSNNLKIDTGHLVTEAATIKAGQGLTITADTIENRAQADIKRTTLADNNWEANLGASLVYRDISRPIERMVTGEEASRFQQASVEDSLAPPTVGADLGVKHLNRKEINSTSTAQVSQLTGGSVNIKARTLDDTGTQYRADTGALVIEAQSHHLAAAQDSTSHSLDRLDVDTGVRVETSTGSDLNLRLAGKGGRLQTDEHTQTARAGSLYGQTGIQVQLGSDGAYEGTRLNAGDGSLRIEAAGDLRLTQAQDQQRQQSNELKGDAWAKGGNSPAGTGLEFRGYLDQKKSERVDTQARVAQIDAKGDVLLKSGGTLELVGTGIGSTGNKVANVTLEADGPVQVKAATDTRRAQGSSLGGGLELAGKTSADGKGGGLGGHFGSGRIDETSSTATGAQWFASDKVSIRSAGLQDDAVHLQGLNVSADKVAVNATNGGLLIEAASSSEHRDNLELTAGAGINSTPGATPEDAKRGLYGRVQVNIDQRDNLTHQNSQWRAQHLALNSLLDTRLEGVRIDAGKIDGEIGGNLRVASRQDRINALKVEADARLSKEKNPQGYINAAKSVAGPLGSKAEKAVGPAVQKVDPNLSPTFNFKLEHAQSESVASQSTLSGRDGIHLDVAGATELSGARLQTAKGKVELGSGPVTQQTLNGRDYRREVGINASKAPVDLITGLIDAYKPGNSSTSGETPVDLGLVRTSGHDRTTTVASSIHQPGNRH